jgi:hypothetical protein
MPKYRVSVMRDVTEYADLGEYGEFVVEADNDTAAKQEAIDYAKKAGSWTFNDETDIYVNELYKIEEEQEKEVRVIGEIKE